MNNTNTRAEVLEIIRTIPEVTSSEIRELMPHVTVGAVTSMVHWLKKRGDIENGTTKSKLKSDGVWLKVPTYKVSDTPKRKAHTFKLKAPTLVAVSATVEELNEKVANLEAWKAEAIRKYPELAVAPVVLRARKLVAEELRASGDHALAKHVMDGAKDESMLIRVAAKALEEGEG